MRDEIPHGRGVMTVGPGELGAGGLADQKHGDRYEGEFMAGFATGMGQYSAKDGTVFRGEFMAGKKDGCGVLMDMTPFLKKVAKGTNPDKAWNATKDEVESKSVYGTWHMDSFVGGPDSSGQLCHLQEILGVVDEVEEVVARARMFQWKPDGEVGPWLQRDANEVPVQAQQDPLHYPHGTGYLMPGPAGNAHAVPENPTLRKQLETAAANHFNIFRMFNVEYDPAPGSFTDKALKLWSKEEKKIEEQKRKQAELEKARIRQAEKAKGLESSAGKKMASGAAKKGGRKPAGGAGAEDRPRKKKAPVVAESESDESGSDFDEDDLVASAPSNQGSGMGGSAFGSITLGLSRAAVATHRMFERAAKKASRMPVLGGR